MRAQLKICDDSTLRSGAASNDVVRPIRFRAEIAAMRADALGHLSTQLGWVERLLEELPVDTLTFDEIITLDRLVTELRQLARP